MKQGIIFYCSLSACSPSLSYAYFVGKGDLASVYSRPCSIGKWLEILPLVSRNKIDLLEDLPKWGSELGNLLSPHC